MKRNHRHAPRWNLRLQSLAARLLVAPLLAAGLAFGATPPPDRLTLLVPDNADLNSWQVKVWTDSAAEEGLNIQIIRDTAFLALGSNAAATIGALVMPDSAHIDASDAVVAAIKQYVYLGGKLMLVYDAGATVVGDGYGFPHYPLTPGVNSRFADMVGVDYVLYNSLGTNMVGFGPVWGTKARLERLGLPPGKYLPALAPSTTTAAFVPTSARDPGGTQAMSAGIAQRAAKGADEASRHVRKVRGNPARKLLGLDVPPTGPLSFASPVAAASKASSKHVTDLAPRAADWVQGVLSTDLMTLTEVPVQPFSSTDSTLQAISGYAYGPLGYFSFVTTGDITAQGGTVYLSSPPHGLVAGARPYGTGQVLFVNMPLGYFKAVGTDSVPLHGFLGMFARDTVGMPKLSTVPAGRGGLVYNWHIDAGSDLNEDTVGLLAGKPPIFDSGPFSIHLTAGPDVVTFGDSQGMNLPGNKTSQANLKKLAALGIKHEFGSHGGWIHDYWGLNASETNEATFTTYLVQNFAAIENVLGKKLREYSSPAGNNPTWALKWVENHGVVGFYDVGNGGAGAVRPWRVKQPGVLPVVAERLTTNMWAMPVAPRERYATFEEFEDPLLGNINDYQSAQWLVDLQSFAVNQRTTRLFYNHPPGAADHINAVEPFRARALSLKQTGRFSWYTMAQVADFSQRRLATTWSKSTSGSGYATFSAQHPTSLTDITWLLPRSRYDSPKLISGSATLSSDTLNWVVSAKSGTSLRFGAQEH